MSRAHLANILMIGGALLIGTQLHADPAPTSPAPADGPTVDVSKLSPHDMQVEGDKMVSHLNENMQHAQVSQQKARKAKDVLKLNCVNDGLLVTKQLMNLGDDSRAKLEKAVAASDHNEQVTQFQSLVGTVKSADASKNSIDSCIGGSEVTMVASNGSKITVAHPIVRDDPTRDCNNLGLSNCGSERLEYVAYASPFTPN